MSSGAWFSWSLPILRWKTSYCSIWVKWKRKNVDCTNQTQLYSKPTSGGPPSQLLVVASRTPRSLLVTKVCHQSTFEKKQQLRSVTYYWREWMKALYHLYLYIYIYRFQKFCTWISYFGFWVVLLSWVEQIWSLARKHQARKKHPFGKISIDGRNPAPVDR